MAAGTTRHDTLRHVPTRKFSKMGGGMEKILAVPLFQMIILKQAVSFPRGHALSPLTIFKRNLAGSNRICG